MTTTEKKFQKYKPYIIFGGIILLAGWLGLAYYAYRSGPSPERDFKFASIAMVESLNKSTTTPLIAQNTSIFKNRYKGIRNMQYTDVPQNRGLSGNLPSNTTMRMHETNKASVHAIGGGANGGSNTSSYGNHNAAARGSGGTIAYSGAIYLITPHNSITEVGALRAGEVVNEKMGMPGKSMNSDESLNNPNNASGPRRVNGYPDIPFPAPIGETPWALFGLLALAFCAFRYSKTRQSTKLHD